MEGRVKHDSDVNLEENEKVEECFLCKYSAFFSSFYLQLVKAEERIERKWMKRKKS